MDWRVVWSALRRNIVSLLVLVIATAAACALVWVRAPLSYESNASMIVLLPNTRQAPDSGATVTVNPYLDVGAQSTQVAASALAGVSVSDEFQAALRDEGVTSDITVDVPPAGVFGGGGVILRLTAVNRDAAAASADLSVLEDELAADLRQKQAQAGAPVSSFLTVSPLTEATAAEPLSGQRLRLVGITAAIGSLVTVAVVLLIELLRRVRRRPTAAHADTAATTQADARPDHPSAIPEHGGTPSDLGNGTKRPRSGAGLS